MQLILKNNGNHANFITWLKGFKDINPTLLLEIDLTTEKFIAKGFPDSRCIVKYSEITFESAGFTIDSLVDDTNEDEVKTCLTTKGKLTQKYANEFTGDNRIKAGIYTILNKVIDALHIYTNTEYTLTIPFTSYRNVKYVQAASTMEQWQASKMIMKSKTSEITVNCSQLSEFFRFLSDDLMLNTICAINKPATFSVTPETIANLTNISQLFISDKARNAVKLYVKQEDGLYALYAHDATDKTYNYLLGYCIDTLNDGETIDLDTEVLILRENLINATKALSDTIDIAISQTDATRVLLTSGTSKIVIASYQNH